MNNDRLEKLASLGQSIWLDEVGREVITSGELRQRIEGDWVKGLRSSLADLDRSIADRHDGHAYAEEVAELAQAGSDGAAIHAAISQRDARSAADELRPLYLAEDGGDGFVSLDLDPHLADDADSTIKEARGLWAALDRPNVLIKVPATDSGLSAIQQLISEGIGVDVTLLFGSRRYRQVAEAYIAGIEARAALLRPLRYVTSVASFSLAPIDALVDAQLDAIIAAREPPAELAKKVHGQTAVASAKVAYQAYLELFGHARFRTLDSLGARVQRLLWASTGTRNRGYSDVKYVDSLIGPFTVTALSPGVLAAYRDHGAPEASLELDLEHARWVLARLPELGIVIDDVTHQLEDEGIVALTASFDALLETLTQATTRARLARA
jgi:transaldolase